MKFLINCDSPDFWQTYLQELISATVASFNTHLLFLLFISVVFLFWFLTLKFLNFFGLGNDFSITFSESHTGLSSIYYISFVLLLLILSTPSFITLNYVDEIPESEFSLNFLEERPTTFFSGKGSSSHDCRLNEFEEYVESYRVCKYLRINKKFFNSDYWPGNDYLRVRHLQKVENHISHVRKLEIDRLDGIYENNKNIIKKELRSCSSIDQIVEYTNKYSPVIRERDILLHKKDWEFHNWLMEENIRKTSCLDLFKLEQDSLKPKKIYLYDY